MQETEPVPTVSGTGLTCPGDSGPERLCPSLQDTPGKKRGSHAQLAPQTSQKSQHACEDDGQGRVVRSVVGRALLLETRDGPSPHFPQVTGWSRRVLPMSFKWENEAPWKMIRREMCEITSVVTIR